MTTRVQFTQHAQEHERFTPGCFDHLIGTNVPWNYRETDDGPVMRQLGRATLAGAEVADDGKSVLITVDLEGQPEQTVHAVGDIL
jgi:hypothetical protein